MGQSQSDTRATALGLQGPADLYDEELRAMVPALGLLAEKLHRHQPFFLEDDCIPSSQSAELAGEGCEEQRGSGGGSMTMPSSPINRSSSASPGAAVPILVLVDSPASFASAVDLLDPTRLLKNHRRSCDHMLRMVRWACQWWRDRADAALASTRPQGSSISGDSGGLLPQATVLLDDAIQTLLVYSNASTIFCQGLVSQHELLHLFCSVCTSVWGMSALTTDGGAPPLVTPPAAAAGSSLHISSSPVRCLTTELASLSVMWEDCGLMKGGHLSELMRDAYTLQFLLDVALPPAVCSNRFAALHTSLAEKKVGLVTALLQTRTSTGGGSSPSFSSSAYLTPSLPPLSRLVLDKEAVSVCGLYALLQLSRATEGKLRVRLLHRLVAFGLVERVAYELYDVCNSAGSESSSTARDEGSSAAKANSSTRQQRLSSCVEIIIFLTLPSQQPDPGTSELPPPPLAATTWAERHSALRVVIRCLLWLLLHCCCSDTLSSTSRRMAGSTLVSSWGAVTAGGEEEGMVACLSQIAAYDEELLWTVVEEVNEMCDGTSRMWRPPPLQPLKENAALFWVLPPPPASFLNLSIQRPPSPAAYEALLTIVQYLAPAASRRHHRSLQAWVNLCGRWLATRLPITSTTTTPTTRQLARSTKQQAVSSSSRRTTHQHHRILSYSLSCLLPLLHSGGGDGTFSADWLWEAREMMTPLRGLCEAVVQTRPRFDRLPLYASQARGFLDLASRYGVAFLNEEEGGKEQERDVEEGRRSRSVVSDRKRSRTRESEDDHFDEEGGDEALVHTPQRRKLRAESIGSDNDKSPAMLTRCSRARKWMAPVL